MVSNKHVYNEYFYSSFLVHFWTKYFSGKGKAGAFWWGRNLAQSIKACVWGKGGSRSTACAPNIFCKGSKAMTLQIQSENKVTSNPQKPFKRGKNSANKILKEPKLTKWVERPFKITLTRKVCKYINYFDFQPLNGQKYLVFFSGQSESCFNHVCC